ncbi:MAG: hypothetical protein KF708_12960 [Pirellulales bacterium]|nr:hypothetical protein [Pirellulales bacterium]
MRYFHRRTFLAALVGGAVVSWLPAALAKQRAVSERRALDGAIQVDLKDMLNKGLKSRRKSEFAFVDEVVTEVDAGRLPRKEVEQVFLWARRQPRHPFQYFQFAMTKQARRFGVRL